MASRRSPSVPRRERGSTEAWIGLHPNDGSLPRGTNLPRRRAVGSDGWTIVAIHDSQESWERFRERMLDALA